MRLELQNHPKFTALHQQIIDELSIHFNNEEILVMYSTNHKHSIDSIILATCKELKLKKEVILSRNRITKIQDARMIIVYICKMHLSITDGALAKHLNRHRTTIIQTFKRANHLVSVNDYIATNINNILKAL